LPAEGQPLNRWQAIELREQSTPRVCVAELLRTVCGDNQQVAERHVAGKKQEEPQRRLVSRVQIFEDQQKRPLRPEVPQEICRRFVDLEPPLIAFGIRFLREIGK